MRRAEHLAGEQAPRVVLRIVLRALDRRERFVPHALDVLPVELRMEHDVGEQVEARRERLAGERIEQHARALGALGRFDVGAELRGVDGNLLAGPRRRAFREEIRGERAEARLAGRVRLAADGHQRPRGSARGGSWFSTRITGIPFESWNDFGTGGTQLDSGPALGGVARHAAGSTGGAGAGVFSFASAIAGSSKATQTSLAFTSHLRRPRRLSLLA